MAKKNSLGGGQVFRKKTGRCAGKARDFQRHRLSTVYEGHIDQQDRQSLGSRSALHKEAWRQGRVQSKHHQVHNNKGGSKFL
jgi:hypothetical protein